MENRETVAMEERDWSRETVPNVLKIVSSKLTQRDIISLLLVSPWLHRSLASYPPLWLVIDLREKNNAGNRLVAALSLARYKHVRQIVLEFAQDIEDKHLEVLKMKCSDSLRNLENFNLNGCQKISDKGIDAVTSCCPALKIFSVYWNVRITDTGIRHLTDNCKHVIDLNLSGCKNISDKSMELVAAVYPGLEFLYLNRCIKLTDGGLHQILLKCSSLKCLNLYAISGFKGEIYRSFSLLSHLNILDLCGAQNLSDDGLISIAKCKKLVSLNLSWCVRVTDVGVIAIAQGCTSLELLSLFGIVGVTDKSLDALSRSCSNTMSTLDVNGCIGIKRRSHDELLQLFPHVICFKVHS